MPTSEPEWDDGVRADGASAAGTIPVDEHDDGTESIVAFLRKNVSGAHAKTGTVRGVDFGDDARPETIRDVSTETPDGLVDVAASGLVVDDIDDALGGLVAEGTVTEKNVETSDGTTTYYRLDTDEARA